MGKPIIAVGIPIPNGNFEYKTDGLGQAIGVPDGWVQSTQMATDMVIAQTVKSWWTTGKRGDTNYPYATSHASRGRCYTVGVQNTATVTSARSIDSPQSPPGYTYMAELNDPLLTTADFWYVRLRMWWRGWGLVPASSFNWKFEVIGYATAGVGSPTILCSIPLTAGDWGGGWVQKLSTPFKVVTPLHHVIVRLTCDRGPATSGFAYGSFTDCSVETVGPADAAGVAPNINELVNGTYAQEGVGGTFYQLTRNHVYAGYRVTPLRQGKGSRLPSGAWRWADPSGGALRRRFVVPLDLLPRTDYEKLYRLWLVNRGQPQELASYYGTPLPLLFSPQASDDPGFYYVTFANPEFPLVPANTWMAATEAGMTYKGELVLEEI